MYVYYAKLVRRWQQNIVWPTVKSYADKKFQLYKQQLLERRSQAIALADPIFSPKKTTQTTENTSK